MQLSNKDILILNTQIAETYSNTEISKIFDKKARIERKEDIIFRDGIAIFFIQNSLIIPTLRLLAQIGNEKFLPSVTVDRGAIPFITKGADVMRPGIVACDEFDCDTVVVIVDETHHKPIAVGRALVSSEELRTMDKGKVIAMLHYVGDRIWNAA